MNRAWRPLEESNVLASGLQWRSARTNVFYLRSQIVLLWLHLNAPLLSRLGCLFIGYFSLSFCLPVLLSLSVSLSICMSSSLCITFSPSLALPGPQKSHAALARCITCTLDSSESNSLVLRRVFCVRFFPYQQPYTTHSEIPLWTGRGTPGQNRPVFSCSWISFEWIKKRHALAHPNTQSEMQPCIEMNEWGTYLHVTDHCWHTDTHMTNRKPCWKREREEYSFICWPFPTIASEK